MVPYAPLPPPLPPPLPSPEGPASTALVAGVMDLSSPPPRRRWHHPRFLNLRSMKANATRSASPATPPTTPPTTVPVGGVPLSLEEPEDADVDEEEGVASMVVPAEPTPPPIPNVDDGDADTESESEDVEDAPDDEVVGLFELEVKLESGLEVVPLVKSADEEDERVVTSDESDWDVVELPAKVSVVTVVEFERVEELDNKDDEEEVNEALSRC